MPRIRVAIGVSPEHASEFSDDVEAALRDAACDERVCAIGSCGIAHADSDCEARAFARQVALACELGLALAVDIAGRDGAEGGAREDEAARSILEHAGVPRERVFARVGETSPERVASWAAWGCYLSFDARSAANPEMLCRSIDAMRADRVLLESGAPSAGIAALSGYPPRADQIAFVADVVVSRMPAAQIAANMKCLFAG